MKLSILPLTTRPLVARMALEDDGNMGEDAVALFGSSVAPTNLDAMDDGVGGLGVKVGVTSGPVWNLAHSGPYAS